MMQKMKKLLAYTLLVCMVIGQGVVCLAEDTELYAQSFDGYTGGRFETLNGTAGKGSWTALPSDKFLEKGTEGKNTYLKMVNDSDTTAMSMTYKFSETVKDGMLAFSYDIAHSGGADNVPRVRVFDESNTERLILFMNAVDSVKKLSGPKPDFKSNVKFEATNVEYYSINAGEPVSVLQVLNLDEDYFETYINGTLLDRVETLPFDNVTSWGLYGYNTVSYFDNLSIVKLGDLAFSAAAQGNEGGGNAVAVTLPDSVTDEALAALKASDITILDKDGKGVTVKNISVDGKVVKAELAAPLEYDAKYTVSLGTLKDMYGRAFLDVTFISGSELDENGNPVLRVKDVKGITIDGQEVALQNGVTPEIEKIKIEFNTYLDAVKDGITLNGEVLSATAEDKIATAEVNGLLTEKTAYVLAVNAHVTSTAGTSAKAYGESFTTGAGGFNIKACDWTTDGETKATTSDVTAGKTLQLSLKIANTSLKDETIYVTYSAFLGDVQKAVMLLPVTAKKGSYTETLLPYTVQETGMEVNGILLDDLTSLTPLASSILPASTSTINGEGAISFSGTTDKNKELLVNILAPNQTYDTLLKADSADYGKILVYHRPVTANEKGVYTRTVDMTGMPSGLYNLYVTGQKADSIIYTDKNENKTAVQWLTGLTAKPTVEELETYRAALGFYSVAESDDEEVLSLLYTAIKDGAMDAVSNGTDAEQRDAAMALYNKAAVISSLNAGKVTNLTEYAEEIGLNDGVLKDYMDLSFVGTSSFQTELTSRMQNREFTSVSDAEGALTEAFLLAAVRYPDGYQNLTGLLNGFSKETGIETNITATIASQISGNNYQTLRALKDAVDELTDDEPSFGGFGGGGGGGVPSSGYVANTNDSPELKVEQTETEEVKEYHVDIFTDLASVAWAKEAIVYLAEMDIIHGDGNFLFYPNNNVTREEFTKMIVQAFAPNAQEAEIAFEDVADTDWFAPFIKKAKGLSIVQGQSETFFGTGQNITRQDMAQIAYQAASRYGITFSGDTKALFADDTEIADYAKTAVYALKSEGIINGKGENVFSPLEPATRAEAAKIIYELFEM